MICFICKNDSDFTGAEFVEIEEHRFVCKKCYDMSQLNAKPTKKFLKNMLEVKNISEDIYDFFCGMYGLMKRIRKARKA
ncbi:MAG: hypothetical protein ACTSWY_09285 [Promethearchaeota archaeon]